MEALEKNSENFKKREKEEWREVEKERKKGKVWGLEIREIEETSGKGREKRTKRENNEWKIF